MKFTLMMCDVYDIEANDIDEANDKLRDFVGGKDLGGIEELDKQIVIEYPKD